MQLTWRQVGVYVGVLAAIVVALIGLFLYRARLGITLSGVLWAVLVCEAVWYAIFCTLWNSGNGFQTWLVDWMMMFATRGVLSVIVAGLVTAAKGEAFPLAFQQVYYVQVVIVGLQVAVVPLVLYCPLFMPRLHPVAEGAPRPAEAGRATSTVAPGALPSLQFNPHDPRAATFEGLLSMLAARTANSGGIVLSNEGLPLASNLPADLQAESTAAYGAEMLAPLQGIAEKVGVGRISQITIHSEAGTVTIVPAQSLTLLAVIKAATHVGLAPEQAQQLAQTLQRLWTSRYGQ